MNALFAHLAAKMQAAFATRERGATAVEYGLLVGLIAVAIIVIVATLGGQLTTLFTKVSTELTKVAPVTT